MSDFCLEFYIDAYPATLIRWADTKKWGDDDDWRENASMNVWPCIVPVTLWGDGRREPLSSGMQVMGRMRCWVWVFLFNFEHNETWHDA